VSARAAWRPLDRRPAYRPKRRKSPLGTTRRGRVHGRSRILASGHQKYPQVNLSGDWLEAAGFPLGQRYEVDVERGRLVLRAV
jgi:toxic protein SymE